MKTLTNAQMLIAARRRLAQHLATRPATTSEATAIRNRLLADAEQAEVASRQRYKPRTADEIGRGPHAIHLQHQEGIAVAESVMHGLRLQNLAMRLRMEAAAWGADAVAAWQRTRDELQARVDYYASLAE